MPKPTIQALECKESSNIAWARYDFLTGVLEVDFKNGQGVKVSTYAYDNYPVEEWDRFRERPGTSRGKFFAYEIRPKYKGRKVWPAPEATKPAAPEMLI